MEFHTEVHTALFLHKFTFHKPHADNVFAVSQHIAAESAVNTREHGLLRQVRALRFARHKISAVKKIRVSNTQQYTASL